jgi:hypothetical protein
MSIDAATTAMCVITGYGTWKQRRCVPAESARPGVAALLYVLGPGGYWNTGRIPKASEARTPPMSALLTHEGPVPGA